MMIVPIVKVHAALARAEQLGARTFDEQCAAAAQALGIPVETVREAAEAQGEHAC